MKKQTMNRTNLVCTKCGNVQTIYRKAYKRKTFGHIKTMWCYKCKKLVNHFEICNEEIEEAKDDNPKRICRNYKQTN